MNSSQSPGAHHDAVEIASTWLTTLHRKGWQNAFFNLYRELLSEEEIRTLFELDEEIVQAIEINMHDWLLAEGDIQARGGVRRVNDYLLSPAGPRLSPAQRDWLQQLGQRPLRLYDVTDVVKGQQMTLCDALDKESEPVLLREHKGTQNLKPGDLLACRVLRVGEHFEMSGSACQFTALSSARLISTLREQQQALAHTLDGPRKMGFTILRQWLDHWLMPTPLPTLIDHYSGDPMVMITDHYRVNDEKALAQALAKQADVEGDRQAGWWRIFECSDGKTRSRAHVYPGKKPDQIELFYKTQRYADEGRIWFEALAGASVLFLTRSVGEPTQVMAAAQKKRAAAPPAGQKNKRGTASAPHVDAAIMRKMMTEYVYNSYAHWADEPIPALGHKTPRQAIQTTAGLERVRGLLSSYQASEAEQAAQQGRPEISYDFLWQKLGLPR